MSQFVNGVCDNFGLAPRAVISILAIVLLWSTFWKLFSMWKSARKGSIIWFIVIALTNTIGILPILYIYVFSKINWKKTSKSKVKNSKKKSRAKKKSNKKRR
jgi:uncharacterized membrane protein